jgi:outer membrane protein TolC
MRISTRLARNIVTTLVVVGTSFVFASSARAQTPPARPLDLAQPEGQSGPPAVITLQDALERASRNDAQFLSVATDLQLAHEDRTQAKAALLPAFSFTTQYLGTKGDTPLATGRFVSNDGVNMYRSWLVAHEEISADLFTGRTLHRADAAEALAAARVEVARRGLAVTVTGRYYALVTTERAYATAQQATTQAQRFLVIAEQQQALGQVARSDVVKADIQYQQQQQAYRESALRMENARLLLAVLLFPDLNQNFTVVDDITAAPALPPLADARAMAGRENPDLRAANEALRVADADVLGAKHAFLPTLVIDADYGIEANEFALHSVAVSAPELGVLPNLGYFVTVNLSMPLFDWGNLRSKLHQTSARQVQAKAELSQTQRQQLASLYSLYNEAVAARSAADGAQRIADLASESLRLINLRYQAGESTALEAIDAQNTLVQARNDYDAALMRYRVAVAELQTVTGAF